jgi:site-specific DNA-methyltransferase (adenine-specific)
MCSYLGSFPPQVPRRILQKWYGRRRTILDPFCGGGTTLLEAGLLGYSTIGIDLNPLAVALARAKTQNPHLPDLLRRLNELARGFEPDVDVVDVPPAVSQLFHSTTLHQLAYLREQFDPSQPEDTFLVGALLGILHGKFRKDGSSAYLSIDMPNTFSMSPNYVRKFVAKNGLKKPPSDVFGKLRERIRWLLRDGARIEGRHLVLKGDGVRLDEALAGIGVRHVGGVVTSPPYLGILRYGAFNWIRLWFLRENASEVDQSLDSTDSLDRYLSFVASFLRSAARVVRKGTHISLVIGDVEEQGQHLALANRVWEELGGVVPFVLEDLAVDDFKPGGKTTRIWGEEKKGRATNQDRILVLRRT